MQKNFPSVKTLEDSLYIDRGTAVKVREIMQSRTRQPILEQFPGIAEYTRACYNSPGFNYIKMLAIDTLLNTHGVESFRTRKGALEYCNAGDTYAATVIYYQGRFRVACWGDIVERDGEGESW